MSELTDLILQTTDPVTALLLLGLAALVLWVRQDLHEDLRIIRGRVRRVEDWAVATDGGVEEDDDGR
ncbi:hypothetical protein D320_22148 [Haloferax sp. BAB-2207]|uniref:Uncharacterized protein n=1 Tax=Haloferax volcanii TaxID=2246 RepID=A0A558FK34_HALVO|nr:MULTISPECIES: hypothetical protein [Haloferax]ELK44119.1 hypothetical protein D320_22148 [Haloferax sp. BAB-2207]TVT85873.1 hypothetical protein FQA18_19740 [Haloferax volcanii]